MGLRRNVRMISAIVELLLVESLIFGLSVLPAFSLWQWLRGLRTFGFDWLQVVFIAMTALPSFLVFLFALMGLTIVATRLLGWRAPEPGEYPIAELPREVIQWAKFSAANHVVRIMAGNLTRASPVWTWYIRGMGAKVGKGVYINSEAIFDQNLLTLEDHVVIGGRAQLNAHLVENGRLKTARVTVRKGATIGAQTLVGPGVEVGERSTVGAMSFVTKNTKIPPNTAYGGVPAKFVRAYDSPLRDEEGEELPILSGEFNLTLEELERDLHEGR